MLCVWCTTEQHSDRVCEKAVMWQWAVCVRMTCRGCDSCLVSSVWLVGEGRPCRHAQTNRAKFLSFACCLSFSALIFIRLRLAPHWKHRTLDCVTQALVVCNTTNVTTNEPLAHNSCQSSPQKLQQSQTLQIYILIDYSLTFIGLWGLTDSYTIKKNKILFFSKL